MARVVKQPEARKGEIIKAARRLLFRHGYAKTTIAEIIDDAEISKGLFYYYFGSKEEILDAIVEQLVMADAAQLRAVADDSALGPAERLMAMLRSHGAHMGDAQGQVAA
jgi:AcrR family transcriptional regulator